MAHQFNLELARWVKLYKRLENKIAVITGGGTGIGKAIAKRFSANGACVAVMGRRSGPIQALADEIGGLAVQGDTTITSDCLRAVNMVKERYGGIDIIVANAGMVSVGSVTSLTEEAWEDTVRVNLTGVMRIARAAMPIMLERKNGAILNVSSVAGLSAIGEMASYIASKHAVIGLTKSMAIDYGPKGVRVNTLCPGWVETPMSDEEMRQLAKEKNITYEEAVSLTVKYLPLNRMAKADEIAACAEFLVSDDASFVTGATLVADGGGEIVDVGGLSFQ